MSDRIWRIKELLSVDAETGLLFWRERPGQAQWNARYAGKRALTAQAYDAEAVDLHGEFARLNFPRGLTILENLIADLPAPVGPKVDA